MDTQKDIQKVDKVGMFVDNQSYRTNPFGDNRVGERAYRRAERLCAAILLVTNHIPDTEPLKHEARSAAVNLLTDVLALRDEMRAIQSNHANVLKVSVRKIISLTRLLAIAGFISFQNADTLCEALDELPVFLATSQRSNLSETTSISREELLDVREFPKAPAPKVQEAKVSDKPIAEIKDKREVVQEIDVPSETPAPLLRPSVSSRARAILEVLRINGTLGIRDIASNLPEYSEKMIQRELAVLVEQNTVKKEGSKRWSTYSLI